MNWKVYIIIFVTFLFGIDAIGQIVDRGPYLQSVTTESIFIKWRTDITTDSKIWFGDSPTNLNDSIYSGNNVTDHEILIDGLTSYTTYYYAIGNGNGQLAGADNNHYFITTAEPDNSQTIRTWFLGDPGTANNNQRAVRDAYYHYIGAEHTDGMLLLGDNAYQDGTDSEYQLALFENMYEEKLINTVLWSTFGNHDGNSSTSNTQTGPYYEIFTFPTNGESGGVASGTEAYYSFDYGNIHFISLNSDDIDRSPEGEMLQWLQNDLDATNQEWVVVFFHHAPYTGEKNNESDHTLRASEMRQNAVPILEAAGVDLIVSGHTHAYQRSFLINGHYGVSSTWDPDSMGVDLGDGRENGDGPYLKDVNNGTGAVYVVAGSAGKLEFDDYNHPVMYSNIEMLGSLVIEVNDLQMDVKYVDEDSIVADYFTIKKQVDPPVVNITNPSNNDYFDTPQTINITADASDSNGSVTQVEFFIDNVSIGIDFVSPYAIDWDIPSEGAYIIKAVATDNDGFISNSSVNIQVGPSSVCSQVAQSSDDAEEKASGNVNLTSSDLELIHDGTDQIVGVRFKNLDIPQCAVIENAFIQFTVDETFNSNPCSIEIYGELTDDATTFKNSSNDLSDRPKTIANVIWSPPDWLTVGESGQDQKTVDIAPVIQEIVDREGFNANSSIVILMEGSGKRVAESYNGSTAFAPEICIEYVPFGPDDDNDGTCNANDLCPGSPEPGSSCDDNDPGTYDDTIDSNCNCVGLPYDCPEIQANYGDPCDDGDAGTYNDIIDSTCVCIGIPYDCPEIQANFGDFCDDGDPNTANDTIDINCNCIGTFYECPNVPGNIGDACDDGNPDSNNDIIDSLCVCLGIISTNSDISHKNDDAEEQPDGAISLTSSDLEMTNDNGDVQTIGLRFNNLGIPKGATIESAYIQFTADQTDNENPCNLEIFGEASDDAITFSNNTNNITNRPKTSASLIWSPPDWENVDDAGPAQQTDDLSAIIQEIVDRNGYTVNGSIVIIIEGEGKRTAYSYDGSSAKAPEIFIEYKCKDNDNDGICDLCPDGSEPGDPCDDGNPATYNDTVDSNCNCIGSPYDCPNIPGNIGDACDDGDPNTLNDEIDSNCNCVGTFYDCPSIPANTGDSCDDGDPNTINDTVDSNCNCTGTYYDCPSIPANIGDSCDDGDPNTINDTVDSDCNCTGTYYDCPSIPANTGDSCDDGDPNTINDTIDSDCNCTGTYYDCPSIPANIGDPCDDGDPETNNDVINGNCICEGGFDCPSIPANIGDPCDDGDPNTINDTVDSNCNCTGTYYDCPSIPANIGDPCDDGDPNTINDTIDSNCNCTGTYYDCPSIPANIGDPCDDGDPNTIDDTIDSNCNCTGTYYDCPSIPANIGDPCDDGDPNTIDDTIDSNCNCTGTYYDCPSIPANIGDPCNDGDPNTADDEIDPNCDCVGIPYDCPNIPGNIGDPCDDGDPNSSNDVIDSNCVCLGTISTTSIINASSDDAEEKPTGFVSLSSSDLEIIIDGSNDQTIGLRFVDLNIPQGAEIVFAFIQFTVDQIDNINPSNLEIFGEASDDAITFVNTSYNITSRQKTIESLAWSPPDWENVGDAGLDQQTVDITLIIQEIVNRNGYTQNSAIAIIIEGEGKRTAVSYDGNSNDAPELMVIYKCSDSNNDGFCDECPGGPQPEESCDDGDPGTYDDTVDSNCNCVGIPYDCPSIPANIGDACDDGNPETSNDMIMSDCVCEGSYDCPSIPANIGDACDDGDPETSNDVINSNCVCEGTYDCPSIPANIGDACDDGNPETSNDVINSNCVCEGSYDCPSIPANIGDPCDDGNPETSNDVINSNCVCEGNYDCPSIPANIGDPCDDSDPGTYNDTIDSNCLCVGIPYDCPAIPANFGDPCDDGDPNSSNDAINGDCECIGSVTTSSTVNQSSDDAEEIPTGNVNTTSSDLEMIIDGNNDQVIGLRFTNLNIPQGATIESAFIQFTVDQIDNVNPSSLNIFGEASDDAVTFSNTTNNITNRTKTNATINWSPPDWENVGDAGPAQKTDDISSIIQEIVDRNGFSSNSSIAVIIEGIGKRTAMSYDSDPNDAPELIVAYSCIDSNNDGFCDDCPGGAEPGDSCDDQDPGTYNDTVDSNCDCIGTPYDCPSIPANINDLCDDGDPGTYGDTINSNCLCEGIPYDCPLIPANIGDPCDDGDPNTINDSIDQNCDCSGDPVANNSICSGINVSSDDAEEKENGTMSIYSSDLEMVIDGANNQTIGLRFTNLNIPQGATIINADVQFTVDQTDNINPCNLEIFGEASDNALTFTATNDNISNRPKTSSSELWSPDDWLTVGESGPAQKTINIASVIQEIVDRNGYTSNSSIVIIIEGVGKRTSDSFEAEGNTEPELCVDYYDPPQSIRLNTNRPSSESQIELIESNIENNEDGRFKKSIIIYPNPATDKIFISFEARKEGQARIRVMDLNGKALITEHRNIDSGDNDILLENLSLKGGIYFVQVSVNEMLYTAKFTVVRL